MADSDSDAGSATGSDGAEVFDPSKLDSMTDKERKKWEKNLEKWRIFMDFLVRHVAIATFKYNCFENEELDKLLSALEKGEVVRTNSKLKKGEDPRIASFKVMRDTTDLMVKEKYVNEANQIRRFLDIAGRMRGVSMIAGGFFKALKKGNVGGLDKIKYYLDYWKGFTVRTYDYSELQFKGVDADSFTDIERRFLVWPTVVRTAIFLSQKFLKKTADSTGLQLISADPKTIQKHMQAVEFVLATKIEDMLFKKVVQESKTFSLLGNLAPAGASAEIAKPSGKNYEVPSIEDIDPELMKPIPDGGMLLSLPPDPPKEKKGGKKKKAGTGKAKSRSASASSHKGKKKKKK